MILNFLFLIPLLILGAICSYTDIKYGKIKNKWIVIGFGWVAFLYLSLVLYNLFFLHQSLNIQYLKGMVINGLSALILGYILWNFKLLAAGDAKLFTLYAFLIPPEFYSKAYFSQFPSFIILINVFIPLLLFLGIKAIFFVFESGFQKIKENKGKIFLTKELLNKFKSQTIIILRTYVSFIFIFVILQIVMQKLLNVAGGTIVKFPQFYFLLFLFFVYRLLFTFISKNKFVSLALNIVGMISIIYLLLNGQTDFLISIIKLALVFMVFVGFFQRFLGFYIEQKETRKIKVEKIEEGMSPSFQDLDNELKIQLGQIDRTGLTKEQVDKVKKFLINNPDKEIKIYKTFALAPFIFLGGIITVLTRDSCVNLVLRVFHLLF